MKKLIVTMFLLPFTMLAQPWSADGICDHVDGQQWNNGGAKGCACTWYTVSGTDTILNCAFGDCGQNALFECVYDCNGHNGFSTNSIPRQCDATASPICWFNGSGSAGELFCTNIVLPIEMGDFWGSSTEQGNELNWTTISESDNDYFELSYSNGGEDFTVLGQINGAGTTQIEQHYRFIHTDPFKGVGYYKIKQVDYNGDFEEYPTIVINNKFGGVTLFSNVYPNPSSDVFYFNYNGDNTSIPIEVSIVDVTGKVLLNSVVTNYNNSQAISFRLDSIEKGSYHVVLKWGDTLERKSVVVTQ